ncbi:hypothetical protein ACJMK2_033856 [Sinanodonta woodiana]|uniref:Uncharacterized protein n=1 Tax=Sinanodonta woodiana TaxID=1069815 RepID=A0ABD3WPP5_SINWO
MADSGKDGSSIYLSLARLAGFQSVETGRETYMIYSCDTPSASAIYFLQEVRVWSESGTNWPSWADKRFGFKVSILLAMAAIALGSYRTWSFNNSLYFVRAC